VPHEQVVNEIALLEKNDDRLKINVGGKRFETYRSTFAKYPDTLLATMFSVRNRVLLKPDDKGEYFFDRNPKVFEIILEFYRTGRLMFNPSRGLTKEAVLEEFDFFQINITEDDIEFCMGNSDSSREKFGDRFRRIAVNRACVRNKDELERVLHLVLLAIYKAAEEGCNQCNIDFLKSYNYLRQSGGRDPVKNIWHVNTVQKEICSFLKNNSILFLQRLNREHFQYTFTSIQSTTSSKNFALCVYLWGKDV